MNVFYLRNYLQCFEKKIYMCFVSYIESGVWVVGLLYEDIFRSIEPIEH